MELNQLEKKRFVKGPDFIDVITDLYPPHCSPTPRGGYHLNDYITLILLI